MRYKNDEIGPCPHGVGDNYDTVHFMPHMDKCICVDNVNTGKILILLEKVMERR